MDFEFDHEGKILSLKAYWEAAPVMATLFAAPCDQEEVRFLKKCFGRGKETDCRGVQEGVERQDHLTKTLNWRES